MKRNIKYYISPLTFFAFYLLPVAYCTAQPSSSIDTNKILIGQQFHVDLKINVSAEKKVLFPTIADTLISQIEVVEKSAIDTVFDKDNITQKTLHQRLTLTSFDSGFFAVPPFTFIVENDTIETEPLLIEVQTVTVDSTQLADIKEPLNVAYSFIDWLKDNWKGIAGIAAILTIIVYLIYYFMRKKPVPVIVTEKPKTVLPPHIIALQKLEKLKQKKLWQSDKVKQYHSELSEILREYLENRFLITALEQTSHEIFQNLRTVTMEDVSREKLKQLLMLSDLVKFAKEIPLATENENSINYAYEFIDKTKFVMEEKEVTSQNAKNRDAHYAQISANDQSPITNHQ